MLLNTNRRKNKISGTIRIISKIIFPIIIIFVIIYFVGKLDMPAPEKFIKQKIPNDKIIIVK